ncbi:DoxX family protein [Bradyrhizobium amphicarpaeae]|nr:DoxX family protein [Bradyrhizobium amphicarpaeae]
MRFALAALYVAAGFAHLVVPDKFLAITPSWVPFPGEVIFATGVCEIAGSIALLTTPLRRWAGVALALYALCVWPANIKHALEGIDLPPIPDSWLYHGPRLMLQPVLIWWALYCAGVIDWPWRRQRG